MICNQTFSSHQENPSVICKIANRKLDAIREVKFDTKVIQIGWRWHRMGQIWDLLSSHKISFQYTLALRAKMYWKLILKSLIFAQFSANMTHFGARSDIPVCNISEAIEIHMNSNRSTWDLIWCVSTKWYLNVIWTEPGDVRCASLS